MQGKYLFEQKNGSLFKTEIDIVDNYNSQAHAEYTDYINGEESDSQKRSSSKEYNTLPQSRMEVDKFRIFEADEKSKEAHDQDASYIDRNLSNSDIQKYYSYDLNLSFAEANLAAL